MNATKATEQRQDSGCQNAKLDERYGKIGISAVAAAVCHKDAERGARKVRSNLDVYDRD
jgi:hypothetical protein